MSRKRLKRLLKSAFALGLCASIMTAEAGAVIKNVIVYGARSVNTLGQSDYRITMDDLKDDYSAFIRTDGLTEYFHKDQSPPIKNNLNEELAWLIDNGIIIRDSVIEIDRGVSAGEDSEAPSVTIIKEDLSTSLYYNVRRSDCLMYLYKAVFD